MEQILSGTPSLESLKLENNLFDFDRLVIASKSLRILVLASLGCKRIEISCLNLERLSLKHIIVLNGPELFAKAIENVISDCSLLESFKLRGCFGEILKLVVSSKSMKRLKLSDLKTSAAALEISCQNLEQLKLSGFLRFETAKLLNLPSSLCATIDIANNIAGEELQIRMVEDILQLVNHVEIGTSFLKFLALPMLNIECLIFNSYDLNEFPHGIERLLHNSPLLEKLLIKAPDCQEDYNYHEQLNDVGENYWNSNVSVFNCLVSHLKTINIIGFPPKNRNRKLVLNFVQFLLKNARVLEKMVVELKDESSFMTKVSEELLSLPRYSQHTIIECRYAG